MRKSPQHTSDTEEDFLAFTPAVIGYPILFTLSIWLVFWFEIRFGFDFNYLGVEPHKWIGLRGIFFSPFIHESLKHVASNSVPLLVLSMALFYFYRKISWRVLGYGLLMTGFLTWCLGERYSVHIGASGVIYCLAGFLVFKGIWSKNYRLIALSLIVVFFYGSLVWGTLPLKPGVSWEGHLSGLISGVILALVYWKYKIPNRKYDWEAPHYEEEDDPFMKHFDENGNFVEFPDGIPTEESPGDTLHSPNKADAGTSQKQVRVVYHYKPSKKQDED